MADIETDEIRDFRETERNGTAGHRKPEEYIYRRKLKKKKQLKVEKGITETEKTEAQEKICNKKRPTGKHGNRDRDNEHRTI